MMENKVLSNFYKSTASQIGCYKNTEYFKWNK